MPTIELTEEQILKLVRQLSPEGRRNALLALAGDAAARRQRLQLAEDRLRRVAAEHGLNWDQLSEDAREELVDGLVHEGRTFPP